MNDRSSNISQDSTTLPFSNLRTTMPGCVVVFPLAGMPK
jgi:hypothetical protein